ncbi:MAG: septal ring lytic transglycosylase RlpA family protein [Verrucomicrobiota bacterium]
MLRAFIFVPLIVFASCATSSQPGAIGSGEWAMASWYGKDFHGKPTASGERFNMYGVSVAHKELPLGTRLRFYNPKTGLSVNATVNDRGPFIAGRDYDLSYGAAKKLGMVEDGVARLHVEQLGIDPQLAAKNETRLNSAHSGKYSLQLASFTERHQAEAYLTKMAPDHHSAFIDSAQVGNQTYYRVMKGIYSDKQSALHASRSVTGLGDQPLVKQL